MRKVAILHFENDPAVDALLAGIRSGNHGVWAEVAAISFGADAQSLARAASQLEQQRGAFDTLLFVTHGGQTSTSPGDVQFRVLLTESGPAMLAHWYEIAVTIEPIVDEGVVLITDVCFSSQDEFRSAVQRTVAAYTVAGLGSLFVSNAIGGTLAFFQASQAFDVADLGQADEAISEAVRRASNGNMATWIPGTPAP